MRAHLPLFLAVLTLYAGGCHREPEEGEPCGGCVGGGTYKAYYEPASTSGTARSYSRKIERIAGGVSISEAHDLVDHGFLQLDGDGLHGNGLTVAYARPATPGTYRLEDLGAMATTSLLGERAFGTHVLGEDGVVSVRFCTGHPLLCADPLIDGEWELSISDRRVVTGSFQSRPAGEHLSCF